MKVFSLKCGKIETLIYMRKKTKSTNAFNVYKCNLIHNNWWQNAFNIISHIPLDFQNQQATTSSDRVLSQYKLHS